MVEPAPSEEVCNHMPVNSDFALCIQGLNICYNQDMLTDADALTQRSTADISSFQKDQNVGDHKPPCCCFALNFF